MVSQLLAQCCICYGRWGKNNQAPDFDVVNSLDSEAYLFTNFPDLNFDNVGQDMLVNDHNLEASGALDVEEDRREFRKFMRKLWLPFFFCITVLACWDHHITPLALKLALFLLSTKPNPLSVYVFVEEVRNHPTVILCAYQSLTT